MQDPLPVLGNRYQVGAFLGAGGFGEVFAGIDLRTQERVAIKRLLRLDPYALVLFKREFRHLADCVHPHLVKYHELINHGEQWWLVMEYIDGVDLRSFVREEAQPQEGGSTRTVLAHGVEDTVAGSEPPALADAESATAQPGSHLSPQQALRLRALLPQLQSALECLHSRSLVHRDLKPANIMVDRQGRLVVLDFGLAGRSDQRQASTEIVGTLRYMSPEHAAGQPATPASDWYSTGVILYLLLTGVAPYSGSPSAMLNAKRNRPAVDPRLSQPGLPADLCALTVALLQADPRLRPSRLAPATSPATAAPAPVLPFVGRQRELTELRAHAARISSSSQGCLVLLHGDSGIGKSSLIQEFLAGFRCQPGALVLEGRCYEREAVPFKALDGVVDALAEHLAAQPPSVVARLLPRYAPQLAHLFPVFTGVSGIRSLMGANSQLEPPEARRRGLLALRELLVRLGESRPLAVVIDDLQWSDEDSLLAMGAVFGAPDPPPLLVICGCRGDHEAGGVERLRTTLGHTGVPVVEIALGPLGDDSCDQLARAALAEDGREGTERVLQGIRRAAHGHPLLLLELSRSPTLTEDQSPTVSGLLAGRLRTLPAGALALLGCLAIAGHPRPLLLLRGAVGMEQGTFDALARLRSERLVRTRALQDDEEVALYHDQVANAVLGILSEEQQRLWHRRLLEELGKGADPQQEAESMHRHAYASGDLAAAGTWALIAASRAAASLAFERAVELYRIAFTIQERGGEVRMRLADVLAAAGRGPEAGVEYRTAGRQLQGAASRRALCRAAGQFLRSGHMDEGLEAADAALAAVHERAGGTARAMWTLTVGRWLHPPWRERLNEHAPAPAEATLERMDALWEIAHGLGGVDTIRAAALHARHLRLALGTGDLTRASKGLAWEAILTFALGNAQLANGWRLVERSEGLALRCPQEHVRAWSQAAAGYGHWCEGRFLEAISASTTAAERYREEGHDVAWELGSVMAWCLAPALAARGDLPALRTLCVEVELEFERLGDRYTLTTLRTVAKPLLHFADGHPERARAETSAAIDAWSRSHWHLQHLFAAFAQVRADLYQGLAGPALERLELVRKRMRSTYQDRLQIKRVFEHHLHSCALAMQAGTAARPGPQIARLRKLATRLQREGLSWASAHAQAATAAADGAAGSLAAAAEGYRLAAVSYQNLGMRLHELSAQRRAAEVDHRRTPDEHTRTALTLCDERMRACGVVEPWGLAAMLVAGPAPDAPARAGLTSAPDALRPPAR